MRFIPLTAKQKLERPAETLKQVKTSEAGSGANVFQFKVNTDDTPTDPHLD